MKKILVTGGTTFVSRYAAEYFSKRDYEVYVLNRGNKEQVPGVKLIKADRHQLKDVLKDIYFDVVADITSYNKTDISDLCDALGSFGQYIMISSSAVYPETEQQPFKEDSPISVNKYWGKYGTDKIEAEAELLKRVEDAYILRPPYLYGPMNNVYREAFVFECAEKNRKFYLPQEGQMKLQFFHVEDLCRLMEIIIETKPDNHIFNVGNEQSITIKEWVELCYKCVGKEPEFINVLGDIEQRNYFSFYGYEYALDISRQKQILDKTIPLQQGLEQAYQWYINNKDSVVKKNLIQYIDENLA